MFNSIIDNYFIHDFEVFPEFSGCEGIIGIGSYFAPDLQFSASSDIDLVVIKDSRFFIKKTKLVNDRVFDLTICSLQALEKVCLSSMNSDYWMENVRYSKVLLENTKKISDFVSRVSEMSIANGLLTHGKAKTLKVKIRNILRKINDNESSTFYFVKESGLIPELMYFLGCYDRGLRPFIHPQRQDKHIAENFPEIMEVISILSSSTSITTRVCKVTSICENFLLNNAADLPRFGVFSKVSLEI